VAGNAEGNAEENAGDAANRAAACTIHGDLVPRTRAPAADSSRTAHGVLPGQAAAAASYAAPVAGSVAAEGGIDEAARSLETLPYPHIALAAWVAFSAWLALAALPALPYTHPPDACAGAWEHRQFVDEHRGPAVVARQIAVRQQIAGALRRTAESQGTDVQRQNLQARRRCSGDTHWWHLVTSPWMVARRPQGERC